MKMSFSPTTVISYAQTFAVIALVAKPLYLYWTVDTYDAVKGLAVAGALAVTVTSILGAVKGHFTADTPSIPKPDQQTTINP